MLSMYSSASLGLGLRPMLLLILLSSTTFCAPPGQGGGNSAYYYRSLPDSHSCAILTDNSIRCWGFNYYGGLGYGHWDAIGDDESPASVGSVNVGDSVTQLALGGAHTCALLEGTYVRCWGYNKNRLGVFSRTPSGQLGYGHGRDIGYYETPASAGNVDVGAPVIKLWGDLLR